MLTIGAIAFASLLLVFMLSVQLGSYDTMINTSVKIHTGHIQVQAEGYHDSRDVRRVVTMPDAIAEKLTRCEAVSGYSFRANGFSLLSADNRTCGALVVGIDPVRETAVSRLESLVQKGSFLSPGDTNRALVGALLAENLNLEIGDEVVVLGQGRDGSIAATVCAVKGIYRTGQEEFDRASMHIPLGHFQAVYSMRGAVHEAVIVADRLDAVAAIKQSITERISGVDSRYPLAVLDWKELLPGLYQSIQLDLYSGMIMYVILIIIVAFSILNTFLMAVIERKKELGVLMAIGTRPGRLSRILIMESSMITLIGICAGTVSGSLLTLYFQNVGIVLPGTGELLREFGIPDRIYPKLSAASITVGPAIVLVITVLTSLYPACKVWRINMVKAIAATPQ